MELSKLFEMQRELDARIEREHPRKEGEERIAKKILALQVELGELCNCWRGFKYWSNDQEPRTKVSDFALWVKNGGEVDEEGKPTNCFKNPLLEEYVDCLHFLLSIGLESEIGTFTGDELMPIKMGTIEIQFITLFKATVTFIEDISYYQEMWELFLALGEMLGFTWEQIEQGYLAKNKINHDRQESGY